MALKEFARGETETLSTSLFSEDEAKLYAESLRDDEDSDGPVDVSVERDYVWLHDNGEWGDVRRAAIIASIMLDIFDSDDVFSASWAETCSKSRPFEFGGGAFAFNRNGFAIESSTEREEALKLKLEESEAE